MNYVYLFPILSVNFAWGAISGFHSLVSSGTTSIQLDKEAELMVSVIGNMYFATFVTVLSSAAPGLSATWADIWPVFGSVNQMLAALAFMMLSRLKEITDLFSNICYSKVR